MCISQRAKVISVYKQLYHMGKEYPKGKEWFHSRLKAAFLKNKVEHSFNLTFFTFQDEKDPKKIEELVARAEFVVKEIEALYYLRKYRAMKNRYYEERK
ncbi:unnamed protein product [Haemonchus placei]|uniref:Complex1_LYR_dom domain-containing protein n=1 Tax=Haemonchus placei TaxID=6290 RepID=A0A158QK98_HAEPC|nr:unnamed protein product [Haemonchus placei]